MRKLLVILALVGLTWAVGAWDAPTAQVSLLLHHGLHLPSRGWRLL